MSDSQKQRLLEHFTNGHSITSLESFITLGITQLATRISELEDKGYKIKRTWVTVQNRFKEPVRVKRYELERS
jgi:hypothetical protein